MPSSHRVTLTEIGARVGVSHVTVSRALRNSPLISAKRRAEIKKVAEEMGYHPDPVLSSLIAYRQSRRPAHIHSSLAWINDWPHPAELRRHKEFDDYWHGGSEAAERFGYRLEEFVWNSQYTPKRFETILQTRNVPGILFPPSKGGLTEWGSFHWDHFAIVRFGPTVQNLRSHLVTSNHFRTVYAAVEKIHSYGYQRIGFSMSGIFDQHLGGNHLGGFLAAQAHLKLAHKIPPFLMDRDQEGGREALLAAFDQWLKKHRPDALVTADLEIQAMLDQLGLRVPGDLAVATTTVQDIPGYAGIAQNSWEIGRVTVETLVALINANQRGLPPIPRQILVDGDWVDGTSMPDLRPGEGRKIDGD